MSKIEYTCAITLLAATWKNASTLFCKLVSDQDFVKGVGMNSAVMVGQELAEAVQVDPVEEIRLRTWARKNYAPAQERDTTLHPIILDEMVRKDQES